MNKLEKEFEQLEYNGKTYNVPFPIESYLAAKYGCDWRTPQSWQWLGTCWDKNVNMELSSE